MRSTRKLVRGLAVAAALTVVLAACSSQGGAQNQPDAAGAQGPSGDTGTQYTIAMVTHEAPGDTFWDKIRAGAEAAARNHGIDLKYSNNREAPQQATLVQNAVDSKVDGIAVTLAFADAVGPAAKAAASAGIPVVAFNSGIDQYKQYGAMMYFGSDETLAGQTAGQRIASEGGGKTICIVQEQGSVALEARCAGVAQGTTTENLNVDGTDLTAVQSTIGAKLQQDPSITHIVALGAPIALAALQAKTEAGSQAKVITFDLNADVAAKINSGEIEFSIDQQPYVQGYEAVDSLWRYLSNGNDIGGGRAVLTGPSFVDQSNIKTILPYAQNNTR